MAVAVEEFVEGHEGFYDTITIDGEVVHEFVTHYYPNVLEAMRTRWISPQFVTTNRLDDDELRRAEADGPGGRRGAGHPAPRPPTWSGSSGRRASRFSEIGCRPPGVRAWDLYAAANDLDIYREWAMAVVHGRPSQQPSRRYSAGHDRAATRPRRGASRATRVWTTCRSGTATSVIDTHLPSPGTPTQPVEAGYMANAWVRMRHPDYDTLREMLDDVGRTLQVRAS